MTQELTGTVALVGTTGAIGKSVATALRQKGQPYRAISRSLATLEKIFGGDPLADLAVWDPDDEASIRGALRGVTAVVYMVGVPYTDFHLHPILMRRVIDAAVAEKVDRLLLIGTLYVFGRPQRARVTEDHPKEPHTFKGRKRKEQEDLVLAAHTTNQIRTSVLRLPDFYGPGVERSLLSDLFIAAKQNRKAKLIGPIDRLDIALGLEALLAEAFLGLEATALGGFGLRLGVSFHRGHGDLLRLEAFFMRFEGNHAPFEGVVARPWLWSSRGDDN